MKGRGDRKVMNQKILNWSGSERDEGIVKEI